MNNLQFRRRISNWRSSLSTKSSSIVKKFTVKKYSRSKTPPATAYGPTSLVIFSNPSSVLERTRTGSSNLAWRSQIKKGENASTQFSAESSAATFVGQTYEKTYQLIGSNTLTQEWGQVLPSNSDLLSLPNFLSEDVTDNKARQKFYKKAREAQRFLQSGVFIGELKQTLSLLRNPAKGARAAVQALVRSADKSSRLLRGGKKAPTVAQRLATASRYLSDSWLEFSFGWRPLASDIKGVYDLLTKLSDRAENEFAHISASGLTVESTFVDSQYRSASVDKPYTVLQNRRRDVECRIKYYGRIRLDVPDMSDSVIMAGLGLTVSDILPTAWELLPWSFFVDYFSNVGHVISGWTYPVAKVAWASKVTVHNRQVGTFWSYQPAMTYEDANGTIKSLLVSPADSVRTFSEKTVFRRAKVHVRPPELRFFVPGFQQKLNIAALAASATRLSIR